jgi:beta-1,4-mannosyltransferase
MTLLTAFNVPFIPHSIFLFVLSWLIWKLWNFFGPRNDHSLRSVAIVVLGDIGRSPRMMYHAQSFAENDFVTDIIGYGGIPILAPDQHTHGSHLYHLGSKPIPALERLPRVQLRYLSELPKMLQALPFVALAPIKIVHQIVCILFVLLVQIAKSPEFIVVQVNSLFSA